MNELDAIREYHAEKDRLRKLKKQKQKYVKPESVKQLEELHYEQSKLKHPGLPCYVRTSFRDDTANALTKCITSWLQLYGHQAERINTMGRPVDNSRIVTDCIGRKRRIGSIKWIPSGSTQGSADVSATIGGRSVKIEVKVGHDRQSEAQKKYQKDIESAGGTYLIARSFDDFLAQIKPVIENK